MDNKILGAIEKYKFSVIIPIYNMEQYLEEAIKSIINQSIGFSNHIQMILVNDGSIDESHNICQKYRDLYPDNIVYLQQENKGVSAARNFGLKYAIGDYINFLDADDSWSNNAFEDASRFFESNSFVFIASAMHKVFGARESVHPLSYKYGINRIVDILETPDNALLTSNNSFIAKSIMPENPFDTRLVVSEDFALMNSLLLKYRYYGLLALSHYNYRKREEGDSAIDLSRTSKTWYLDTPKYCYQHLFDISLNLYGHIIPYIQYCVMYDLQWRLRADKAPQCLNSQELREYIEVIKGLISNIDKEIILSQRKLLIHEKLAVLALKNNMTFDEIKKCLVYLGDRIYVQLPDEKEKPTLCFLSEINKVFFSFLNVLGSKLILEGEISKLFSVNSTRMVFRTAMKCHEAQLKEEEFKQTILLYGEITIPTISFKVSINLESDMSIEVFLSTQGDLIQAQFASNRFWGLDFRCLYSYWKTSGLMLWSKTKKTLHVTKEIKRLWLIKREFLYEAELWARYPESRKVLAYRRGAFLRSLKRHKKEIWLISDRVTQANDNGEAFFEYLAKHKPASIKPFFVISKESDDYQRLKKTGKTIDYGSKRYKKLFLKASKIVSSAADYYVINAFDQNRRFIVDLCEFDFVFLQHGITKDDCSGWLNKHVKNIGLFITSTEQETESIINNPVYSYSDDVVKCCGMPRYDKLIKEKYQCEKQIIIMPTWRQSLAAPLNPSTGFRAKIKNFTGTDYFQFFNSLINNERLKITLEGKGYKGLLVLHPAFAMETNSFDANATFDVINTCNYTDLFNQASLLVTDYSSVAFDFAILKKPVVYAQFDRQAFFQSHLYSQGYYDYERDGFGPICETLEETVNEIIRIINNDCILDTHYCERIDRFFTPRISDCCEKTLNEIMNMDKRKRIHSD